LAVFWNVGQPPAALARAFLKVYRRVLPGTPFASSPSDPLAAYASFFAKAADEIRHVGTFSEPERWQFDWDQHYTKEQWLEQVPPFGGHSQFPRAKLDELLAGLGAAIDATSSDAGSIILRPRSREAVAHDHRLRALADRPFRSSARPRLHARFGRKA
jgi:hypothetical protein